ncbi:DNA-binding transcriptional regulator AraC [Actinobacillus pleuropneumoniae]|nr:DNA-binding transcriptional regulator AraC [Actinobacillus pleuropneumoniae]
MHSRNPLYILGTLDNCQRWRFIAQMYTVLIAENEPWVLKGIVEMVKSAGEEFQVAGECSNGKEAWSMIQEVWPMLLITDIMMPELDGLSLIKRIAEHRIPLVSVIISGYDNFQYAQKAMSYGVSEYLLKPVEFETLTEALGRSKEKLESLKDLNDYIVKFQSLLDNNQGLALDTLMHKQSQLIQSVLRLNTLNKNARIGLLNIMETKLRSLLSDIGAASGDIPKNISNDDGAILKYYMALLEKWYLEYPVMGKASLPEAIAQSCRHIEAKYKSNLTLTEMANLTNFSISHFSALFKKHTGSSLVGYINRLRIDEAKKLLRTTSYAISEIAEIVGYTSSPYFTRVFKAHTGVAPLEYRRRTGS